MISSQTSSRRGLIGPAAMLTAVLAVGSLGGTANAVPAPTHLSTVVHQQTTPTPAVHVATPPPAAPTCAGSAAARSCDLWARAGTTTLHGTPGYPALPVWGFSVTATGLVGLTGPTLVVNAGDRVTVHLHNTLALPVSLGLPAIASMTPASDTAGATPGTTADYTFTATAPGTFLYQAGPTVNQAAELAMGLVGALVVRPAAPGRLYDDTSTTVTDEAVAVLSDVDPQLNTATDPAAYLRTHAFAPTYRLLGGQTHPDIASLGVHPGGRLGLRTLNAGSTDRALAVYGLHQMVVADDGAALPVAQQFSVTAETIAPSQTLDTVIDVPSTAPAGQEYVLADSGGVLADPQGPTPAATVPTGGVVTTLLVGGTPTPPTCLPTVTSVSSGPATVAVGTPVPLTATARPCPSGTVGHLEYSDGANGPWVPMTTTGTTASGTAATASVTGLSSGAHVLDVRAVDGAGAAGPAAITSVYVDGTGPTTTGVVLAPSPYRPASGDLQVSATGDDRTTGGSTVDQAEAFDGGPAPVTGTGPAPTPATSGTALSATSGQGTALVSFAGTLTLVSPPDGPRVIWVRTHDALGSWGAYVGTRLVVDSTGPVLSGGHATPNPTNGVIGWNVSTPAVRASVTATDALSTVTGMTGWVDTMTGPGAVMLPASGSWISATEVGYLDIPLSTVRTLSEGQHTVLVVAADAAGNTSSASIPFTVDRTAPTWISGRSSTTGSTHSFTTTASDAGSGVGAVEWFAGRDPGVGKAHLVVVQSPTLGTSSVMVVVLGRGLWSYRVRDVAGNWTTTHTVTVS